MCTFQGWPDRTTGSKELVDSLFFRKGWEGECAGEGGGGPWTPEERPWGYVVPHYVHTMGPYLLLLKPVDNWSQCWGGRKAHCPCKKSPGVHSQSGRPPPWDPRGCTQPQPSHRRGAAASCLGCGRVFSLNLHFFPAFQLLSSVALPSERVRGPKQKGRPFLYGFFVFVFFNA